MRIYTLAHASLACSLSRCDKKFFSQGTARHSVRFSGAKPAFWISCTAVDVTKSAERDWQLLAGCVIIYLAYSSCSRSYKTHSETCVISEKGKTFFKKRTCYRGQYMSGSDSGIQCRRDLWCTSYRNDRLSGKDIKESRESEGTESCSCSRFPSGIQHRQQPYAADGGEDQCVKTGSCSDRGRYF